MLLRSTDPFRDFDRLAQQLLGTTNRPAVMPMDAWREGDAFTIEFDLPGVAQDSIDLDVERNVLTVRAERVPRNGDWEMLASERPRGVFSRQLVLGDNLDLDRIEAAYDGGVLRLVVPVAEKAKPRRISVGGLGARPHRHRGMRTAGPGVCSPGLAPRHGGARSAAGERWQELHGRSRAHHHLGGVTPSDRACPRPAPSRPRSPAPGRRPRGAAASARSRTSASESGPSVAIRSSLTPAAARAAAQ